LYAPHTHAGRVSLPAVPPLKKAGSVHGVEVG